MLRKYNTSSLLAVIALVSLAALAPSCSSSDDSSGATGGTSSGGKGGTGTTGGATSGGRGGATTGGTGTTGGTSSGGTSSGGTSSGGATAGGTGGATTGGTGGTTVAAAGDDGVGGEAGAGNPPACIVLPGILYDFDAAGSRAGWQAVPNGSTTDSNLLDGLVVTRSATVGRSCVGSLAVTIPFSVYSATESADIQLNYSTPNATAYVGKTLLHAWVKIQVVGGNAGFLNGLQFHLQSTGYSNYLGPFLGDAPSFADGQWHELKLDLTAPGSKVDAASDAGGHLPLDLADINQLGLQVSVAATAPTGAPAAPTTTTVYLDDIWVE